MFKKCVGFYIGFLLSFGIACTLSLSALAASETKEIFTLDNRYNMVVSILFDKEMPTVSFTAPSGKKINSTSLQSDSGDDWVQYYILDAEPGTWTITYDKLSNTQFEINYASYMEDIRISDFTFSEPTGNYVSVSFAATASADQNYHYAIYAVITDDNGSVIGEHLLQEGQAKQDTTVSQNVYVGDLVAYEDYQLRLDVWQRYGVEETFDSKIADGNFAISNHANADTAPDFRTEISIADGDVRIDWGETAGSGEYVVALFDDSVSKSEPFFFTEITDGRTSVEAIFDPNAQSIRVEFTHRKSYETSPTRTKIIPIANNGVTIETATGAITNASQAYIKYEVLQPIEAELSVNGKTDTLHLKESGSFSVEIAETYNEVDIQYSLDDPLVKYMVRFPFSVDRLPPTLRLPENKSAVHVDTPDYVLAGVTEPESVLMIAGDLAAVNEDGTFVHTTELSMGENIIEVTATDAAGNVSAQDVIINRTSGISTGIGGSGGLEGVFAKYRPLISAFVLSMLLLLTVFILRKGLKRTSDRRIYLLKAFRNISAVLGGLVLCAGGYCLWKYITLRKLAEGEEYFAVARKSIEEAYQTLYEIELYARMLLYIAIAALVCILSTVILRLTINALQKRKENHTANTSATTAPRTVVDPKKKTPARTDDTTGSSKPVPNTHTVSGGRGIATFPKETPAYICPNCHAKYDKPIKFCGICGKKTECV